MLILIWYIFIDRIFASEASNGSAATVMIDTNISDLYQGQILSLQPSLKPIFRPFNFSGDEGVVGFNKSHHNLSVNAGDFSSNKSEGSRSHAPTNQVIISSCK